MACSDFEDFVGFHKVDKVNADTLAAVIKDVVLRMNLDLHNCRGQCYDGAANMARSRTGTATQLRHVEERAICTHCYGHALNLAVADVVKQSKVIRDVLDTVGEINKLLKYSPRRALADGGGGLGGLQPPLSSYYIIRKMRHK